LWLPAQHYDAYNCPHKCEFNGQAFSQPIFADINNCESQLGGTWDNFTNNMVWRIRDGLTTTRQTYTDPTNNQFSTTDDFNRKQEDDDPSLAYHESWEYYDNCYRREANRGMLYHFVARI
jgi:hypothetical protein